MNKEKLFINGFNHGYLITKHEPELATRLAKGIQPTSNDYVSGFISGKEEYEIELSKTQLDDLQNIREGHLDRNQDIELEP